jgi:ferredoxin
MSERVRVAVDPARCVGSGTCVGIAPDHFELHGGVAQPRQATVVRSEELLDAVDSCPVAAITLRPAKGDADAG